MNCRRTVVFGWKSKVSFNNNKPSKILGSFPENFDPKHFPYTPPYIDKYEICGGKITAQISVEYVGCYEGEALFEDAGIGVKFVCDRCGSSDYPNLPNNVDSLNEFLTRLIEKETQ